MPSQNDGARKLKKRQGPLRSYIRADGGGNQTIEADHLSISRTLYRGYGYPRKIIEFDLRVMEFDAE